jgi:hypothetical protein
VQESRIFHPQADSSFEDLDSTDAWDVLQDVQRDTNTIPLTGKIDVFSLRGWLARARMGKKSEAFS